MERHPGILWRGYHMKTALQKFGKFLSAMVMPNIGAFIAWGFITALFIADGWLPNEQLASIQPYMLTYLLPILIAATGGQMIAKERGMVIGAIAGVLCCFACGLKFKLGYDDSLDVVGVHGVGGLTGTVLIGFFGEGTGLLAGGDWRQLAVQVIIALCAMLYSGVVTAIIAFALEKTIGWRVTEAQEVGGIDLADQGERAYDFAGTASSVLKEVR